MTFSREAAKRRVWGSTTASPCVRLVALYVIDQAAENGSGAVDISTMAQATGLQWRDAEAVMTGLLGASRFLTLLRRTGAETFQFSIADNGLAS